MMALDPIIAVKDVAFSAEWYQKIFGFKNTHGGTHFAVLTDKNDKIILCLHAWAADGHPTMMNENITVGNGLLLYFRTENWMKIKENLEQINWSIEEKMHRNKNSHKMEFSFRDPDNYFLTVTEYHEYEG